MGESMVFDGVLEPEGGVLRPERSRPGNGLELKQRMPLDSLCSSPK